MYYQAYKNIDRERLEDVNLMSDLPRTQGRTFMFIMQMLGEAWLGDPNNKYLFIGERFDHSRDIMCQFAEILKDEGFTIKRAAGNLEVLRPKPCTFRFIGPDRLTIERNSRGIRWDDVYVDLTYETADKAQRELEILTHTMEVYHARSSTH